MRKSFLQSSGEIGQCRVGSDAQDGFAETEDAMRSFFHSSGGGIVGGSSDHHLQRVMCEERSGQTIRRGEHSVLTCDSGKALECFLRKVVVPSIACERV